MLEKILVPLDGSSLAECVLNHVRVLAQVFGSQVVLLHVMEQSRNLNHSLVDPIDWQLAKIEATAYFHRLAGQLSESGLQVECVLLEGHAPQQIVEYAHANEISLTVLSSHGSSGLRPWSISGVVHKVIALARSSIMIVRAYSTASNPDESLYRHILVPLDGSTRAECVLPFVSTLAARQQGELILTHIAAYPQFFHRTPITLEEWELINDWTNRNVEKAEAYLRELQSQFEVNTRLHLEASDDAIAALHDVVDHESVNLMVLSAHGISGKHRWPYGSMVNSFINDSPCPLLIIQDMAQHMFKRSEAEMAGESSEQVDHRSTHYAHS